MFITHNHVMSLRIYKRAFRLQDSSMNYMYLDTAQKKLNLNILYNYHSLRSLQINIFRL